MVDHHGLKNTKSQIMKNIYLIIIINYNICKKPD